MASSHFQRKVSGFDRNFFGVEVTNFGRGCQNCFEYVHRKNFGKQVWKHFFWKFSEHFPDFERCFLKQVFKTANYRYRGSFGQKNTFLTLFSILNENFYRIWAKIFWAFEGKKIQRVVEMHLRVTRKNWGNFLVKSILSFSQFQLKFSNCEQVTLSRIFKTALFESGGFFWKKLLVLKYGLENFWTLIIFRQDVQIWLLCNQRNFLGKATFLEKNQNYRVLSFSKKNSLCLLKMHCTCQEKHCWTEVSI